jgi:hypothetical protein
MGFHKTERFTYDYSGIVLPAVSNFGFNAEFQFWS